MRKDSAGHGFEWFVIGAITLLVICFYIAIDAHLFNLLY